MNTKYVWAGLLLTLLAATRMEAQVSEFEPQTGCPPLFFPVEFTTTYFAEPGVVSLEMNGPEDVVELTLPVSYNLPVSLDTYSGSAYYTLIITRVTVDEYDVQMLIEDYPTWYDNTLFTLSALDASRNTLSESSARMYVANPPTVTIVNPATSPTTVCMGSDLTITTTVTSYPDFFQWQFNGVNISGAQNKNVTLSNLQMADAGTYQLLMIDMECGVYAGPTTTIVVTPSATITDVDMAPKPCNPGETVTFQATALNIDNLSTYTWVIGGTNFTTASLPATVVVSGNTLRVNSIVNTPLDMTSTTSVVTIENISAPGAPSYTADVSLEVGNNTACVATTATVMSGTSSVFPVEWLDFQIKARDQQQVELHWATASETNNANFLIERATDARTFRVVGELAGKGTTSTRQDYYFVDDKLPAANQLSYRIKQVDFDGAYSYSELRNVALDKPKEAAIRYFRQQGKLLNISFYTPSAAPATVVIYDLRGVRVFEQNLGRVEGIFDLPLNLSLASGMYVLHFRQDEVRLTRKVVLTQ